MTNQVTLQATQAQEWVEWFFGLGPELFIVAVLIICCLVMEIFGANKRIMLAVCLVISPAYYTLVAGNQLAPHWVTNPNLYLPVIGFVVGFAGWAAYIMVPQKWRQKITEKLKTNGQQKGKEDG